MDSVSNGYMLAVDVDSVPNSYMWNASLEDIKAARVAAGGGPVRKVGIRIRDFQTKLSMKIGVDQSTNLI